MSQPDSPTSRLQRCRLTLFRTLAALLLFLAILGFASLSVGAYLTMRDAHSTGWFPPVLLSALTLVIGLLIRVCIRALKIKSVDELEEQSKSKWLVFEDSPSPNNRWSAAVTDKAPVVQLRARRTQLNR